MATAVKKRELDFGKFPADAVNHYEISVCLACIFDVFTKQLSLAPRTAYLEVKRHTPTIPELTGGEATRPYFKSEGKTPRCPYCNSAKRWHARFVTHRIDGGKATDAARRALVKSLPKTDDAYQVLEIKSEHRALFFEWLEGLAEKLDFDDTAWLISATRAYLERKDPKTDWSEVFKGLRGVRPSRRVESGFEYENGRMFVPPSLYNEILMVQYLVSRSHKNGGLTWEGRLTMPELMRRLRYGGYLKLAGIAEGEDVLEQLVDHLTGGSDAVKIYYIVDRRDFLEKVKTVYSNYAS